MGPTTGLEVLEKRRLSRLCWDSNPGCPILSQVMYCTDYVIPGRPQE